MHTGNIQFFGDFSGRFHNANSEVLRRLSPSQIYSLPGDSMKKTEIDDIFSVAGKIAALKGAFGDIITENAALHSYIMQKKVISAILAVHKYKISPYSRGGVSTWVPDPLPLDKSHRKLIVAASEAELYVRLAEWYGLEHLDKFTLDSLFKSWEDHRRKTMTDVNTIKRDHQRYERYFRPSPFFQRTITSLHRSDWKEFCCQVITGSTRTDEKAKTLTEDELKMTRKEWGSTRCILNGMLELALDKELITMNPLTGMKFDKHLFREPRHKDAETQVFNTAEQAALVSWCRRKFSETEDVAYLLPPFNLLLGSRIGECVALTWDNVLKGNYIEICKEEKKDRDTYKLIVAPHTKTFHNRVVPINDEAVKLLDLIRSANQSDEWIFARNGERLTSRQANYVLERYAKENGLSVKSSHALRRTYGSNLFKAGATSKQCSNILGNTVEVFERYYLHDTDTEEQVRSIVDKVSLERTLRVI